MKKVLILRDFPNDFITRKAGEKLRQTILMSAAQDEATEIDFSGVTIGSTSFFDESIAKLIEEGWDTFRLEKFVHLKLINPLDLEVMREVCKYRKLKIPNSWK